MNFDIELLKQNDFFLLFTFHILGNCWEWYFLFKRKIKKSVENEHIICCLVYGTSLQEHRRILKSAHHCLLICLYILSKYCFKADTALETSLKCELHWLQISPVDIAELKKKHSNENFHQSFDIYDLFKWMTCRGTNL